VPCTTAGRAFDLWLSTAFLQTNLTSYFGIRIKILLFFNPLFNPVLEKSGSQPGVRIRKTRGPRITALVVHDSNGQQHFGVGQETHCTFRIISVR